MAEQRAGSETRMMEPFTRVNLSGVGQVVIVQGETHAVEIEGPEGQRERARVEVSGGALNLGFHVDWWDWLGARPWESGRPRFRVTMKQLAALTISGAGSVEAERIETERLELVLSGAGSLTVGSLQAARLDVRLHSVGSIDVSGKVIEQSLRLSGAGSYRAGRLESETANVHLSGVGSATVWVRTNLDAHISGAGSIEYYGTPRVSQHVSGVGSIRSIGAQP
jgi:hypothetical protein